MPKTIPGTTHMELILQYLFITHHFLYFLAGMLLVFMSLTSVYLCYVCHYEEVLKVMRLTPSQEMPTEPSSQPSKAVPAYRSWSQVFVSGSLCFLRKPHCRGTFFFHLWNWRPWEEKSCDIVSRSAFITLDVLEAIYGLELRTLLTLFIAGSFSDK